MSKPWSPASAIVGISGSATARFAPRSSRARTLPTILWRSEAAVGFTRFDGITRVTDRQGNPLEWATTSPPPPYNFERVPPIHSFMPLRDLREAGEVAAATAEPAKV